MDIARPRIRVGKISAITTHGIGPSEKAKLARNMLMKRTSQYPVVRPVAKNRPTISSDTNIPNVPMKSNGRRPMVSIFHNANNVKTTPTTPKTTCPPMPNRYGIRRL